MPASCVPGGALVSLSQAEHLSPSAPRTHPRAALDHSKHLLLEVYFGVNGKKHLCTKGSYMGSKGWSWDPNPGSVRNGLLVTTVQAASHGWHPDMLDQYCLLL